jgi:hypothetical protein
MDRSGSPLINQVNLVSIASRVHHFGVARKEVLTASYDAESLGDLKALVDRLAGLRESRWFGRSRADIAGLLLVDAVHTELAKYASNLTQDSQSPVIGEPPIDMIRGAS